MPYPWWTTELNDVIARAKDVAMADPDFAKRVFEDPNATVKARFGYDLPVKVKLVWLTENRLGLVPFETQLESGDELSDDLLDLVSARSPLTTGPAKTTEGGF